MIYDKVFFPIKYSISAKKFIFVKIKISMMSNVIVHKIVKSKSKSILTFMKSKINKNQSTR